MTAALHASADGLRTAARTMTAAVITAPQAVEMREVPMPRPGKGQVGVRLEGCGVCASNVPPWEGREWFTYPMEPGALGHEGWGRVDAVGEGVTAFKPGDRVAMISGHAYAQFDVADEGSVIALPDSLDGRPFPAEPLGCAVNIFARAGVASGMTVAIVGIGFLGAVLTRMCADAGATVLAVSRKPDSLAVARARGAHHCIAMDDHWRIIDEVRALTGGRLCDVVIEATGKQWPLDLSAELCKERGRLVIAGYHQDGLRQVNMQLWNWRGFDIASAHERDPAVYLNGMRQAAALVASGRLDPSPLFTHVLPLSALGQALELTRSRPDGFVKALVVMP